MTRAAALAALALLVVAAFAFQGSRGLYSPDEGRYSGVALEMLRTGDFLHPRLHAELPHYTKPPLTYWAIAASVAALGHSELGVRAPYALAYVLTVLFVFGMGRVLVPERPWLPALIYATTVLAYEGANVVTTDVLLAFAVALYTLAFVRSRAAHAAGTASHAARALLGFGAGLAFVTKGPPGLLPLLALLLFAATTPGEPKPRAYSSLAGWLLFVGVGLGWYLVIGLQQPELVRYFLVEEVWHRVASSEMHRNAQWYGGLVVYVPTLLLGLLPWSLFALAPVWRFARAPRAALERLRADRDALMLAWWIVLPLTVFFIARSRLPLYLLPLFAPLAIALARQVREVVEPRAWQLGALAAWLVVLVGVRAYVAQRVAADDDRLLAQQVAALGLGKIDEVVFVDTAPRYGLIFYLDAEVEHINLQPEPGDTLTEDVATELAEREGCRLFLVAPKKAAPFRADLGAQGPAIARGAVGSYTAFLGRAEDDCDWPAAP